MSRYIAFLRAINVGGHTVKMQALRDLFIERGFAQVETFIASGNVIFDAPSTDQEALEVQIEEHLRSQLGYEVATFLRTPEEISRVAAYQAFAADALEEESSALYVGFLKRELDETARQKLNELNSAMDSFDVNRLELYWLARKKMGESPISGNKLEKTLGQPLTMRNITTVKKLAAKYG